MNSRPGSREELSLSARDLAELSRIVLEKGKSFSFRARGLSMHPIIRDGDTLTISPLGARGLKVGDIAAAFRFETHKLVIHRVISMNHGAVLLQGDNALESDDPIPLRRVIGRLTRVERKGREVALGLGPERALIPRLAKLRKRRWARPFLRLLRPLFKP